MKLLAWISRIFLLAPLIAFAQEHKVNAVLEATTLQLGVATRLNINVEPAAHATIQMPDVENLVIRQGGSSRNTSIINGAISSSNTYTFLLIPQATGSFSIPSIPVIVGGKKYETGTLNLKVVDPNSGNDASGSPGDNRNSQLEQVSFIQVSTDKDALYLGEGTLARIRFFILLNARVDAIRQFPSFANDAILMNPLGQDPQEGVETVAGKRYRVFTWETPITALKAGKTTLEASAEIDLLVPSQRRNRTTPPGFFDDSFFDDSFFGTSFTRMPLQVFSNSLALDIRDLPPAPTNSAFTGAVGQFEIKAEAQPLRVGLGDPITLTLTISGTGNFDRVSHTGLASSQTWKSYDPQVEFNPSPGNTTKGHKTFKQALIPMKEGQNSIPALEFTYLDPRTGSYQSIHSDPIPISVDAPKTPVDATALSGNPATSSSAPSSKAALPSDRLIDIALNLDRSIPQQDPLIRRPASAWLLVAPWMLIPLVNGLALRLLNWRSKTTSKDRLALRSAEKKLTAAYASGDKTAYLNAAVEYSRNLLSTRWSRPATSITLADLKASDLSDCEGLMQLFQAHNAMQYSGTSTSISLPDLNRQLQSEWVKLGNPNLR